jgi:hypothetical protein
VAGLCKCELREAIAAGTYLNLGPWLITLAALLLIDVYRVGTIEKLRWKRTRRERMLEQCSKQCSSTPISDKVALCSLSGLTQA